MFWVKGRLPVTKSSSEMVASLLGKKFTYVVVCIKTAILKLSFPKEFVILILAQIIEILQISQIPN